MTIPVWIIDDDKSIRWVFEKALARENIKVRTFSYYQEVIDALAQDPPPDVVVSDIRMPGGSGFDLLAMIKKKYPQLPVIIMTAYSDLESAVTAFQEGAFEYLPKPFDVNQAVSLIQRALAEVAKPDVTEEYCAVTPEILGRAPAMQEIFRAIGRLSQSDATVLITGESGSGKELVARALHRHSPRSTKPFVAINTAAIPKDLLESELFGHEKGAFTGAQTLRRGRFEQAEGGTLFLDEIGDMPTDLQAALLRVLSDKHFYRVGGSQPVKANVRIIAATHQDLEARVSNNQFREDLFHRLNVIRLRLPPLRERQEDIPLLIRHFLQQSARNLGLEVKRAADSLLTYLSYFPFPGNVRQLENLCHWLTVMTPGQTIDISDLPPDLRPKQTSGILPHLDQGQQAIRVSSDLVLAEEPEAHTTWQQLLEKEIENMLSQNQNELMPHYTDILEKILIRKTLYHTHGRRIEAAQILGMGRNTLTRKIQELKLEES